MEFLLSSESEQGDFLVETDAFSSLFFIEQGLECIRQGRQNEGIVLLRQAREQIFPNHTQVAFVLDAFIAALSSSLIAQQALHEASRRFVASENEQQIHLTLLRKLLPGLKQDVDKQVLPVSEQKDGNKGSTQQSLLSHPLHISMPEKNAVQQSVFSRNIPQVLPALYVTCFGRFEVRRASPMNPPIVLCRNLKGQTILRYLLAQPKHSETVDTLMSILWPDDAPEIAHHKLQVAISALRRSLNSDFYTEPGGGYILCKGLAYQLNPTVHVTIDVDEFLSLYQVGQQATHEQEMISTYEKACRLYGGHFLAEDLYADWSFLRREYLSKIYIGMCDRLAGFYLQHGLYSHTVCWANEILTVNRCDEDAHRKLMRVYAAEGRRSEALRQYQHCQHVLAEDLGVQPMPETQRLFELLLGGEAVLTMEKQGR